MKALNDSCIDHGKKGGYYRAYCKRLKRNFGLHRMVLAYKLGVPIEALDGVAMYLCDNKRCINPNHLMLGTQSDNVKSAIDNGLRKFKPHPNQLTDSTREVIMNSPLGARALAKELGISHSTISRIRNGKA